MHRRDFIEGLVGSAFGSRCEVGGKVLPTAENQSAVWHAGAQLQRRRQVYEVHQKSVGPLFDEGGRWTARSKPPERREMLWDALSFLATQAIRAKGNAVILEMLRHQNVPDHFVHMAAAQLLIKDKGELSAEARGGLCELLYRVQKEARASPIQFLGYNDNFPAMETTAAFLGGQVLDYAPSIRRGHESLERLTELFARRGLLSEYTSPTYSAITLLSFAEISTYAPDAETAALARAIEERIWLDLATHFHAPTNGLAGPHSRAYTVDSVGHLHQLQMVLYHVFGDRVWMNPVKYLFPPAKGQVVHHDGDVPFMQASNVWMASGTYHPSHRIASLLFEKTFPYRVSATAEYGPATGPILVRGTDPDGPLTQSDEVFEYPSGELTATTYMTEDYAVGTATAQFHNGCQTDTFFVNFRRSVQARSFQDISTIYCRYTTNENRPGAPWKDPRHPDQPPSRDLLADWGRVRALQKDNTALVMYQAKGEVLDAFTSLRLIIVIPSFYRSVKRILIGDREVQDKLPFASEGTEIIWLEDDLLFAAFSPLKLTNHGREHAIRIAEEESFLSIALVNYEGPRRTFTRKELLETLNGFVAEVGSRSEGTFSAFRRRVLSGKIRDEVTVGQRCVEYRREGVRLAISHSLAYDGLKYMAIDGKPQPRPIFHATGLRLS